MKSKKTNQLTLNFSSTYFAQTPNFIQTIVELVSYSEKKFSLKIIKILVDLA